MKLYEAFISVYSPNRKAKRKSETYNDYWAANKVLREEADLCTIIKSMRELEMMKKVLFNHNQLSLFEFMKNRKRMMNGKEYGNTGKKRKENEEEKADIFRLLNL